MEANFSQLVVYGLALYAGVYFWRSRSKGAANVPDTMDSLTELKSHLVYGCEQGNTSACTELAQLYDANYLPISG